jgi:hypothetical protein
MIPVERMSLARVLDLAARIADPGDGADEVPQGDRREAVDVLRCEVVRLQAIVEGRAVPPTDEEIAAHALRSGRWLLRIDQPDGRRLVYVLDAGRDDARAEARAGARDNVRWWALECGGWPCAWPTTEGGR